MNHFKEAHALMSSLLSVGFFTLKIFLPGAPEEGPVGPAEKLVIEKLAFISTFHNIM
jgi:hypothetical protein